MLRYGFFIFFKFSTGIKQNGKRPRTRNLYPEHEYYVSGKVEQYPNRHE